MPRKISLSFLGTGGYRQTEYFFPGPHEEETFSTPLIQVAVQRYLERHVAFDSEDRHVLLLTDDARKRNYLSAAKPHDGPAEHRGLKAELLTENSSTATRVITVPAGHDRDSVIETFDRMAAEIGEGDEVYLDVTHGFRSLPMLALVLGNFIRVARGAEVKAIYYGAFEEAKDHDGRAPVYDLAYLLELQEWTTATYGYLEYGFTAPLSRLATQESAALLKVTQGQHAAARATTRFFKAASEVEDLLRTNRGHELETGAKALALDELAQSFVGDGELERGPLPILVERIAAKTAALKANDGLNWLRAARLAFDDGLIQQACSLLREGMVTYVCKEEGLDYGSPLDRVLVEKALNATGRQIARDYWDAPAFRVNEFERLMASTSILVLFKVFASISPFRNDLMHAGYYHTQRSDNARPATDIMKGVLIALTSVEEVLYPKEILLTA